MTMLRTFLLLSLLLVPVGDLVAQQRTITGHIVSQETLVPLEGVAVAVQGTTTGTVSDPEGRYTIQAPTGATLVFTALGYTRHHQTVQDRDVIDVELAPAEVTLQEIVAVGYAGQDRSDPIFISDYFARRQSSDPVTYEVSGRLDAEPYQLPIDIVTALQGDTHLRGMTLSNQGRAPGDFQLGINVPSSEPSFQASFGFASLEDFHAWYAQQGTALHRAIEQTAAGEFRFDLSVKPTVTGSTF